MHMAHKKTPRKKVKHLTLSQCEQFLLQHGGHATCMHVQHVLQQYHQLLAAQQLCKPRSEGEGATDRT